MNYKKWTEKFMDAWKARDIDAVMDLISKECKYYETVFEKPCESYDKIKELWKVVPTNQKDISYKYEIISEGDKFAIVNFFVRRTLVPSGTVQNINGIFQISLDKDGLCTFFKQWRSVKEE